MLLMQEVMQLKSSIHYRWVLTRLKSDDDRQTLISALETGLKAYLKGMS